MRDYMFMLLILLIPLIPAFVLFRFLPESRADVEGPLKGLTIKLGGAFGGYVVGVLLSWQIANFLLAPTWSDNWTVVAKVVFDEPPVGGSHISDSLVLMHPPTPDLDSEGNLQMMVAIPRVHTGAVDIPRLIVACEGYETANVPLDSDSKHLGAYGARDYQVTFDSRKHQIIVRQPIVLAREPQETATTPISGIAGKGGFDERVPMVVGMDHHVASRFYGCECGHG